MYSRHSTVTPSEAFRLVFERLVLPISTAYVLSLQLNGFLKTYIEVIGPPYGEVLAHVLVDNLLFLFVLLVFWLCRYIDEGCIRNILLGALGGMILRMLATSHIPSSGNQVVGWALVAITMASFICCVVGFVSALELLGDAMRLCFASKDNSTNFYNHRVMESSRSLKSVS